MTTPMPPPSAIPAEGSVQQGLSAAGGALGFYQLGLATDERNLLRVMRSCVAYWLWLRVAWLLAVALANFSLPAFAFSPYAILIAEVTFEPGATALEATQREKIHQLIQAVYGRLPASISCPDLTIVAEARADDLLPGTRTQREVVARSRLKYLQALFDQQGILNEALFFQVISERPFGHEEWPPNLVTVEARVNVAWSQDAVASGTCTRKLR